MKMFLIVFSLALLFVIGSAGMMRYFDKKNMPEKYKSNKSNPDKPNSNKTRPDDPKPVKVKSEEKDTSDASK